LDIEFGESPKALLLTASRTENVMYKIGKALKKL
jgi:hypothetical protein